MGKFRQMPIPTAEQVNLPACSPHLPFNAERQAVELAVSVNTGTNFEVIGLTKPGINQSLQQQRRTLYLLGHQSCYVA